MIKIYILVSLILGVSFSSAIYAGDNKDNEEFCDYGEVVNLSISSNVYKDEEGPFGIYSILYDSKSSIFKLFNSSCKIWDSNSVSDGEQSIEFENTGIKFFLNNKFKKEYAMDMFCLFEVLEKIDLRYSCEIQEAKKLNILYTPENLLNSPPISKGDKTVLFINKENQHLESAG